VTKHNLPLATLDEWGWHYAGRTAKNAVLSIAGVEFAGQDLTVQRGEVWGISQVAFTQQAYGLVLAVAWWEEDEKEPIYLVSNLTYVNEVCRWYAKRFRIKTLFSDQKSRGFHLHKSHLSDPGRLSRLMIAAALAYLWMIFLGARGEHQRADARPASRTTSRPVSKCPSARPLLRRAPAPG
jgi:hypothetical protein